MSMSIYKVLFQDEVVYVGSSNNLHRRWKQQHLNPDYKNHRIFGKWIHENNLTSELECVVIQTIDGKGAELKKKLLKAEFLWKRKLNPRFGVLDGLKYQPIEVQREIAKLRNKKRYTNLYQNLDHETVDKINEKKRMRYKNKHPNTVQIWKDGYRKL